MAPILSMALLLSPAAPAAEPPAPPEIPAAAPAQEPAVWLGVFLEDAADGGVEVLGLVPGGPADRGGLLAGDVLLAVEDAAVLDLASLNQTLRLLRPGQRAELRLLRSGSMRTVPLVLGDRAKVGSESERRHAPQPKPFGFALGVDLVDIPPELRTHYGAPPDAGALVVKLDPEGPAAQAGLRVGDVLVRAGERPVQGPADVLAGLLSASAAEVPFEVVRARKAVMVTMPRPALPRPMRPTPAPSAARVVELTHEVERLRARVAELEAELEKARRE